MLLFSSALAEDASQADAFKAAWDEYTKALETNRPALRIETSRKVLELAEQMFPETDERLALIMQNHGVALRMGRQKGEARELLRKSLKLMEAIHGDDSVKLIPVLCDLADANSGRGDERGQLKLYKRAMKISAANYGADSLQYADLAFRAATSTFSFSHSVAGEKYLREAHDIYARELEPDDLKVGMALFILGKMQYADRDNKKAAAYLLEALQAFKDGSDEAHQYRLMVRALLVQVYEAQGKSDLATEHCVAIGKESQVSSSQDYEPLFRAVPRYPRAMLRRGVEGHVDLTFTVNTNGFVEDAKVIDTAMTGRIRGDLLLNIKAEDRSFNAAALAAVKRFRYAPRFEDDVAVHNENVKTRIRFSIEN